MMYTQLIADIVSAHSDSMERIASRSTGVTSSISSIFPIIISIAVIVFIVKMVFSLRKEKADSLLRKEAENKKLTHDETFQFKERDTRVREEEFFAKYGYNYNDNLTEEEKIEKMIEFRKAMSPKKEKTPPVQTNTQPLQFPFDK